MGNSLQVAASELAKNCKIDICLDGRDARITIISVACIVGITYIGTNWIKARYDNTETAAA